MWRQVFLPGGGGGTGPNPKDDVKFAFWIPESSVEPTDDAMIAMTFPDETVAPSDDHSLLVDFPLEDQIPRQTDWVDVDLIFPEVTEAPTDLLSYDIRANYNDDNNPPTETVALSLKSFDDSNTSPTDGRKATARWTVGATKAVAIEGSWSTVANAEGTKNGTLSTYSDSATRSANGIIALDPYPDPLVDLTSWTITKVEILWYMRGVFSAASTSKDFFEYSLDGTTWVTLNPTGTTVVVVNFDDLATPRIYDITASRAWTWTDINNLRTRYRYVTTVILETATIDVDAVEIRVTATKNPL